MLDRLGTFLGFFIGVTLIIFGITWPDNLSNYYVFHVTQYESQLIELKKTNAPRKEIQEKQEEMRAFKGSWEAGITRFVDLKSILIVLGGSYAATLIAFPFRRSSLSLFYIFYVFAKEKRDEDFEVVYNAINKFSDLRFRKQMIPDEEVDRIPLYFLRDAINNFIQVDWVSEEMVQEIISSEIEMYAYNQDQEISVMEYLGKVAPAFGMLGTVVGLILLMGQAAGENSSIGSIMGGMSVALITTLYGVLLSQLFFLPVAEKLHRRKDSYIRLYEMIREGVLYMH
ncbi:MAG: MotA/TolQ/ExbB proton channel family protein, partial [Deltaproteobacteria bacterium]|nr:MotA/TolQ/ExbB proton channel family protein [Deltaproteobacteria bacterium]